MLPLLHPLSSSRLNGREVSTEVRELKGEMNLPRQIADQIRVKIKKLDDHKRQKLQVLERR